MGREKFSVVKFLFDIADSMEGKGSLEKYKGNKKLDKAIKQISKGDLKKGLDAFGNIPYYRNFLLQLGEYYSLILRVRFPNSTSSGIREFAKAVKAFYKKHKTSHTEHNVFLAIKFRRLKTMDSYLSTLTFTVDGGCAVVFDVRTMFGNVIKDNPLLVIASIVHAPSHFRWRDDCVEAGCDTDYEKVKKIPFFITGTDVVYEYLKILDNVMEGLDSW